MKLSLLKKLFLTTAITVTPLTVAACSTNFIPEAKDQVLKAFSVDFLSKVVANGSGSKYFLTSDEAKSKLPTRYLTAADLYVLLEFNSKNTTGATSYTITFDEGINYLFYYVVKKTTIMTGETHISGIITVTGPNSWIAKNITGYQVPSKV